MPNSLPIDRSSRSVYAVAAGVLVIAVLMRLPSCFESFWLDELHSAWSVWGSLYDVATRAAAGNQTPPYFWFLWVWKQFIGDSELALRLPSVLATSLAAAVISIGIHRVRGSLLAGTVAGLAMAIDTNASFYGTELRPFAFVILLGAVACCLTMLPMKSRDRVLPALAAVVIIAAAIQPTSIAVLGWLLGVRFFWMRVGLTKSPPLPRLCGGEGRGEGAANSSDSRPLTLTLSPEYPGDGTSTLLKHLPFLTRSFTWAKFTIIGLLAIGFVWLSCGVLQTAWNNRAQWSSLGRADSIVQIWQAWPWMALVIVPALFVLAIRTFARTSTQEKSFAAEGKNPPNLPWWVMSVVAIAVVSTFWLVSAIGIAPVFHRRYFIACLPILAWACGDAVAQALDLINNLAPNRVKRWAAIVLIPASPLVLLILTQCTATLLLRNDFATVRRGEGWREAVEYLRLHHDPTTVVWLSPGLIECSRLLADKETKNVGLAQRYLAFPLAGPYSWQNVKAFDSNALSSAPVFPVVLRGRRDVAERWLAKQEQPAGGIAPNIHSFGGVQVIDYVKADLPPRQ